jgi:hypothetical protein
VRRSVARSGQAVATAALREGKWCSVTNVIAHTIPTIVIPVNGLDQIQGAICWEWPGLVLQTFISDADPTGKPLTVLSSQITASAIRNQLLSILNWHLLILPAIRTNRSDS